MKWFSKIILLGIFMIFGGSLASAQERGADESVVGWSPDSTQVAILSNRTGLRELYIVDASGNITQPFFEGRDVQGASVAPDGQIAVTFISPDDNTTSELHLANFASGETKLLATIAQSYGFSMIWSPDGKWLALPTGDNVLIVNATTGENNPLVDATLPSPRVTWSPNSHFIAVITYDNNGAEEIYVYGVGEYYMYSGNLLKDYWSVEHYCCLTMVAWSPDSTQLAISITNDANIYLSTVASEELVPFVHTSGAIQSLQWAADGSAIYYMLQWRHPVTLIPQEELGYGRSGGIYGANLADGSIEPVWIGHGWWTEFTANAEQFWMRGNYDDFGAEFIAFGNVNSAELQHIQLQYFKSIGIVWSPDGTMVATAICLSGEGDADVYLVDSVSGNAVNVTGEDAFIGEPQPSNCPGQG